jgi:hypothetical protein
MKKSNWNKVKEWIVNAGEYMLDLLIYFTSIKEDSIY